jgi:hypothetical protein
MKRLLVLRAAVLLLGLTAIGQGQALSFDVRPLPPAQLKSNYLWDITLQNPTLDTWSVYFHVEAYAVGGRAVFAANTQDFALAPGERTLSAREIRLSDIWCERGSEAFAEPDSLLPEGDYTYNITLVPEMMLTSFLLQVRAPRPLELLWPRPGGVVSDSLPLLAWKGPVVPWYTGEYLYSVRVAEMQPGKSCSLATSSEASIVEHCRSSQTVWRYSNSARRLVPGRTYAWRVEA